jgi:hypothetical protein
LLWPFNGQFMIIFSYLRWNAIMIIFLFFLIVGLWTNIQKGTSKSCWRNGMCIF